MIARDQWFDKTWNFHSNYQQASDKGYEQKVESDTDVSLSNTKISGWSGLNISLHGRKQVTKYGSYLRDIIMMDSGTTTNMFENPNMIKNRQKADIPMNFRTNEG